MSERLLEYNDTTKICLICGCHTEQAINIYEPRSGPNIIEIIQAKFKFQPVNDDKYLCFSCNNWLINWHSLQVLNTKEADANHLSGKSRLNNCIPEESEIYLDMQLNQFSNHLDDKSAVLISHHRASNNLRQNSTKRRKKFYFSRRCAGWNKKKTHSRKTTMSPPCALCGHPITLRSSLLNLQRPARYIVPKCKNCRRIMKWRTAYLKSIIEEENRKLKQIQAVEKSLNLGFHSHINLVTPPPFNNAANTINDIQKSATLRTQRPLVDGKVVAMLRRLGTTLTREGSGITATSPIIMSPAKKKPQKPTWQQHEHHDDDVDIVLDFNIAISEVLPMVAGALHNKNHINNIETINLDDDDESNSVPCITVENELDAIYNKIPKCVSVSVINVSSETPTIITASS